MFLMSLDVFLNVVYVWTVSHPNENERGFWMFFIG